MNKTLGFSAMDCHMDFFAIWMRGAVSTSTDVRSAMLEFRKKELDEFSSVVLLFFLTRKLQNSKIKNTGKQSIFIPFTNLHPHQQPASTPVSGSRVAYFHPGSHTDPTTRRAKVRREAELRPKADEQSLESPFPAKRG